MERILGTGRACDSKMSRRTFVQGTAAMAAAGCGGAVGGDTAGPDATSDAGFPFDAGERPNVDAGRVDAGGVDAGGVDAGGVDAGGVDAQPPPSPLAPDLVVPAGVYTAQKSLESDFGRLRSGQVIDCSQAMFIQDSRGNRAAAHNFNPRIQGLDGVTVYRLRATGSMGWREDRTAAYRRPHGNGTNFMMKDCRDLLLKEAFFGSDNEACNWDHIKIGAGCANLTVENCTMLYAFDDVSDNPRIIEVTYRDCWLLSMMGPAIEQGARNPQTLENCTIELHQVHNTNNAGGARFAMGASSSTKGRRRSGSTTSGWSAGARPTGPGGRGIGATCPSSGPGTAASSISPTSPSTTAGPSTGRPTACLCSRGQKPWTSTNRGSALS